MDALAQQCIAGSKVAYLASSPVALRMRMRRSCILTSFLTQKFAAGYVVLVHRRPIQPLYCSSSDAASMEMEMEVDELAPPVETPAITFASDLIPKFAVDRKENTKTVQVRFVLQKECYFGEQFFVVGNDPACGLWEPSEAIPMEWSTGHVWNAELDLPVEREMLFKFILKGHEEEIIWQPGPDRSFQTWDTDKTIIVSEDWDTPEHQKITEGEEKQEEEVLFKLVVEEEGDTEIDTTSGTVVVMDHQNKILEAEMNTESDTDYEPVLIFGAGPLSASGSGSEPSHEGIAENDEVEHYNSSQSSGEEVMDDASQQSNDGEKSEEMLIAGVLSEDEILDGGTSSESVDNVFQNDIQWVFQTLKRVHNILGKGSQ